MANPKRGVKIPGGTGKCIRPGGHCNPEKACGKIGEPPATKKERTSMIQSYREIELSQIKPSPFNPRKSFSGPKFDELVASIKEKGVIEPIVVRSKNGAFEIVAGERRFRALSQISRENGNGDSLIPAVIRELDDDQAFEVQTIENLVREDLTELEEARCFQAYLERRKGVVALEGLAERTGVNPRYIRRRVAVLALPESVLEAWETGAVVYGHLEQLLRLNDDKEKTSLFEMVRDRNLTVKHLREEINEMSPELSTALFDLSECLTCVENSDVQKNLFGDLGGEKLCLNRKCFKQKQNNWLLANWKKYGKKYGTNGFRFMEDVWNEYNYIWSKAGSECKVCNNFVSLVELNGKPRVKTACIGDNKCFNKQSRTEKASRNNNHSQGAASQPDEPASPDWHGTYFRERFFRERIPVGFESTDLDGLEVKKLILAALLKSNRELFEWFSRNYAKREEKVERGLCCFLSAEEMLEFVLSMKPDQLRATLKDAAVQVVLQRDFSPIGRRIVGEKLLGLNLAKEWVLDEEYLNKKTKAEILKLGEEFGVFADKKAKVFLFEKLLKKRGEFKTCKKSELVRVFIESGVDLAGKVPAEILSQKWSWHGAI
ncbi:MAG: ParB/RepB/Spo0J family partition protein [Desulforudis sp.]|nr:MAG: ParB/RepB/Spo0J family partition protein [Desulforudis sp.]